MKTNFIPDFHSTNDTHFNVCYYLTSWKQYGENIIPFGNLCYSHCREDETEKTYNFVEILCRLLLLNCVFITKPNLWMLIWKIIVFCFA
jgi:hypothetical protein